LKIGLPLPGTSGDEVGFWDRFNIGKETALFLADSHLRIQLPKVSESVTEVVNFDAHHDAGYGISFVDWVARKYVTCADWAIVYQLAGAEVKTVYPSWKPWAMTAESDPVLSGDDDCHAVQRVVDDKSEGGEFNRTFICRSSG
jgi:hypothetical protein